MRFLILALIAASVLIGCAKPRAYIVDPAFDTYVERFQTAGNMEIDNIVIEFGETGPVESNGDQIVGYCHWDSTPQVVILKSYFDQCTDAQREELLFHELGHCVLNRLHISTEFTDGCPISIMDPYVLQPFCYSLHYKEYLTELFSEGK